MALAGDLKLKNFLVLAGGGLALAITSVCGGLWWMSAQQADPQEDVSTLRATPAPAAPAPAARPAPPAPAAQPPAPAPASPAGLSEMERAVMAYNGRSLGSSKLKDVSRGKPYKINVYQDDGHTVANRAKVDLDRDDRWDEKWTFKADGVQRQIAPNDDEAYTRVVRWTGTEWAEGS